MKSLVVLVSKLTKGEVTGYTFAGTDLRRHSLFNLNRVYAAADLLSTTEDLSLFSHALMQGKVINIVHLHSLLSPVLLNNNLQSQGSFTYSFEPVGIMMQ